MPGKTLPESHSQYSNAPAPPSHQTHTPGQREIIHLTALTLWNSQDLPFMGRLNTQHRAYKGVWNSTGLMLRKKAYRNLLKSPCNSLFPSDGPNLEPVAQEKPLTDRITPRAQRPPWRNTLSWLAEALTATVTQLVRGNKNNSCMFKLFINKT